MNRKTSNRTALCLALFLMVGFVLATPARTDWINLTGAETSPNIAEIYVLDDHVKLVLEVYIADLTTFDDLVPDDWIKSPTIQRPPTQKRLQHFSSEMFQFVTGACSGRAPAAASRSCWWQGC